MSRGFRRRWKDGWNEETETSHRSNQKRAAQVWCYDVQSYSIWFHMIWYDYLISYDFTWVHIDFWWFHMISHEFIWFHMSSYEFIWFHMSSYDFCTSIQAKWRFSPKKSWIFGGIFRGHWTCAQPQSASGGKKTSSSSSGRCGKASTETIGKHCRKGMPGRLFSICGWWILQMKCVNLKDIWAAKFMLVCPTWDSCRLVPCRCALPTHTPVRQVKSRVVESLAGPEGKRRAQVQNSVRRGRISQWQHHWQNDPSEKRFLVIRKEACLFYCTVLCMLVKVCMNFWILEGCKLHENGDSQYCRPSDIPGKRSGQNSCFARSVWNVRGNIWNMEFNCQIYTSDIKRMTHGAKV